MSLKKVILFGLSANPPTGLCGHQGIVRSLVSQQLYDEVWVMPVFHHMFTSKRDNLLSFQHRFAMCEQCFAVESTEKCTVRVTKLEEEAAHYYLSEKGPEYRVGTVDILDYLNKQYNGIRFSLALGLDTFSDLASRKWKESERLLSTVNIIVYHRLGIEFEESKQAAADLAFAQYSSNIQILHQNSLQDVSSTMIRKWFAEGKEEQLQREEIISPGVLHYIKEHNLYR